MIRRSAGSRSASGRMRSTYSWSSAMNSTAPPSRIWYSTSCGRGGRIDAVDDGAERLRGLIADQPLLAGVGHDGDALARAQPLRRQRLRRARHHLGVVAPRPFAVDAELLGAEGDAVGLCRARSSSRAGAVVRRSSSADRSLAAVPLMTLRNASTFRARPRAERGPCATSSAKPAGDAAACPGSCRPRAS